MSMRRGMPYEQRNEIDEFNDRFERIFGETIVSWPHLGRSWSLPIEGTSSWCPPMDLREDTRALTVKVQLPGIEKKDVKISVNGDVVEIRGERKESHDTATGGFHLIETHYGTFARSFTLPSSVDPDHAKASFNHGELTVIFPKQARVTARTISIGGHGAGNVAGWFENLGRRLHSLIKLQKRYWKSVKERG